MEHIFFKPEEPVLRLLDQRYLPEREEWFEARNLEDIIYSLQEMVVRGAPAIGITAAYGCCLLLKEVEAYADWQEKLLKGLNLLKAARPTAVNLTWAVDFMSKKWEEKKELSASELYGLWVQEALALHRLDIEINRKMGSWGAKLLEDGDVVMTHCNAGSLATGGFGTALGVIRAAIEAGKKITVIANETRPFLQGARLTAYELQKDNIEVIVACDNACGFLMQRGKVSKVIVGADRITSKGDVANKIGTYSVAVLAKKHNIPFYVAAPLYTIDPYTVKGEDIPIEERKQEEVTHIQGKRITPAGVKVFNYAFDVTPAELVSGIITEEGVFSYPYDFSFLKNR